MDTVSEVGMKKIVGVTCLLPLMVAAQTVEIQPVDIIYGNQVVSGRHQVVLNSPGEVAIRSYFEQKVIAAREQAIYDEVNKRTQEAPFTVLFTGHIPDDIQEKRLRMMPEIGVFGEQLNKLEKTDAAKVIAPDSGEFSEIKPGATVPVSSSEASGSQEDKLEKLIGG